MAPRKTSAGPTAASPAEEAGSTAASSAGAAEAEAKAGGQPRGKGKAKARGRGAKSKATAKAAGQPCGAGGEAAAGEELATQASPADEAQTPPAKSMRRTPPPSKKISEFFGLALQREQEAERAEQAQAAAVGTQTAVDTKHEMADDAQQDTEQGTAVDTKQETTDDTQQEMAADAQGWDDTSLLDPEDFLNTNMFYVF